MKKPNCIILISCSLTIYFHIFSYTLYSQSSGIYKLSVIEKYAFGEYSPTGDYSLSIYNSSGIDEITIDFSATSPDKSTINYKIRPKTFFTINEELYKINTDYIEDKVNSLVDSTNSLFKIDHKIDSLFNAAIKILSNFSQNKLNIDYEKRTLPSKIDILWGNDSLRYQIISNCEWDLSLKSKPYWNLIQKPLAIITFFRPQNILRTTKLIDITEQRFLRFEYSWNSDSTLCTTRTYDFNASLIQKTLDRYSNKVLIEKYSIDSNTGDTIKINEVKSVNKNEKSNVYYYADTPSQKTITKFNENKDIIEISNYNLDPYDKKLKLHDKYFYKYEYNPDGIQKCIILLDNSNVPIQRTNIFYGKLN